MKREQRKSGIASMGKMPEPKPCPTCYRPMLLVDGRFECEKHGAPDS